MAIAATCSLSLATGDYRGNPGIGERPFAFSGAPGPKPAETLQTERLDIDHVELTSPDGKTRQVPTVR